MIYNIDVWYAWYRNEKRLDTSKEALRKIFGNIRRLGIGTRERTDGQWTVIHYRSEVSRNQVKHMDDTITRLFDDSKEIEKLGLVLHGPKDEREALDKIMIVREISSKHTHIWVSNLCSESC